MADMEVKIYGEEPVFIEEIECNTDEMFFYQYLPIKLSEGNLFIPDQLKFLQDLIYICIDDFISVNGADCYNEHYMYVTAKRLYITKEKNLNREGFHSDGFLTNDINYIWSDLCPTEFISGSFKNIPKDCDKALEIFNYLASINEVKTMRNNCIYRLNDKVIHSVSKYNGVPKVRNFVKISFSKDQYNLKGNSHNYLIDYKWEMKNREIERNHPHKIK